jgi:hypothetical protein
MLLLRSLRLDRLLTGVRVVVRRQADRPVPPRLDFALVAVVAVGVLVVVIVVIVLAFRRVPQLDKQKYVFCRIS